MTDFDVQIYDLEVFKYDWIAVFRNPDQEQHTVFHNDTYGLRQFLRKKNLLLGGFNNKHYDDYVMLTMMTGGSPIEVKKHNDYIIKDKQPSWKFPFIQGKKKPYHTFDLRDDISDPNLSLKAIEGNLGLPIVESSVPFDIDRPLTKEEVQESIHYCKHDVNAAIELYKVRKEDYLDAKMMVGELYGVPPEIAIGLTNAKLSARVLKAKPHDFNDERDYVIPKQIDQTLIPQPVMDFFMQIHDKSISDVELFGDGKNKKGKTLSVWYKTGGGRCPVTYAWGGVHGAQPCITVTATDEYLIVNFDVESLYPNSMINFGYCSRAMENPDDYKNLVYTRIDYKHAGDTKKAGALKLVVNTVFGAMLSLFNALSDRRNGRSVCITNQMAITMLIMLLGQKCGSIDFLNINTDGLMFKIHKDEIEAAETIIEGWCETTGFNMERDDFQRVIQKDVNNYIGIKTNGKMKTKGTYTNLYKGGNFKTNSMQVIHKALVDYLVSGVLPEETIRAEKNIIAFQQIVKTGSSYAGSYQYINGERRKIQNVNRIYASNRKACGPIVKGKWTTPKPKKNKKTGETEVLPPKWSETIMANCPEHPLIDNENHACIADLDMQYYIDAAYDRIKKYKVIDKKTERILQAIKEEITIMPTVKKETTAAKTESAAGPLEEAIAKMNIYQKLQIARMDFLNAGVKKNGVNRFAEYKYFDLPDIVPAVTKIFNEVNLLCLTSFTAENAIGTLVNTDKPDETIVFTAPMKELDTRAKGMNSIQADGAVITYMRRYLYYLVLDIVENDTFDATQAKPEKPSADAPVSAPKKSKKPATPEQRKEIAEELIDADGKMTDTQLKSIKNGLKKLRDKSEEKYEPYIRTVMKKVKGGATKTEAESLLIEIGEKVKE